jgi:hypothetical protein
MTTTNGIDMRPALSDAERLCANPADYFDHSYDAMELIPRERLARLQIEALQHRFGELRDSIPILRKLADAQEISEIEYIDDVVPLLFEHTMYKSYRSSLLVRPDASRRLRAGCRG